MMDDRIEVHLTLVTHTARLTTRKKENIAIYYHYYSLGNYCTIGVFVFYNFIPLVDYYAIIFHIII